MDPRRLTLALTTTALVSATVAVPTAQAHRCRGADRAPHRTHPQVLKHAVRCLVDHERAHHGMGPLHTAPRLGHAARGHAVSMVRRGYFSHYSRTGRGPADRARAAGYLRGATRWRVGEDIAWGQRWLATPRRIVAAFMHSPEHRAVILTPGYRSLGIGVTRGVPGRHDLPGGTYVLDFGARG